MKITDNKLLDKDFGIV